MTDTPEIRWLLDELVARVPGVEKALVLTRDGLNAEASAMLSDEDAERLAAMAAAFHSLARGAVRELDGGGVRQVVVEMESAFLFITAAGAGSCLAVVSSAQADLGLVAYEMAVLIRRVGQHLSLARRSAVSSGGEVM
jgi:predicted regulator of Ras-like GTPase activity (Roadblock/LC7/MglB family)